MNSTAMFLYLVRVSRLYMAANEEYERAIAANEPPTYCVDCAIELDSRESDCGNMCSDLFNLDPAVFIAACRVIERHIRKVGYMCPLYKYASLVMRVYDALK